MTNYLLLVTSPLYIAISLHGEARKQGVVATSSAKAEFRGMTLGLYEAL